MYYFFGNLNCALFLIISLREFKTENKFFLNFSFICDHLFCIEKSCFESLFSVEFYNNNKIK